VDYAELDDGALLRLINNGQESALSELYDRYSRLVYSMAYNSLGEQALAEEITQDVFLRVWQKADTYRPGQGKVITWMASITRYRTIDVIRRRKIRPEGNLAPWAEASDLEQNNPINVESEVETHDLRWRVRQAINQLPDEQRLVLSYAYFQGYTHSQIAEIVNEPLGTVKTRIRLAMQKLRMYLHEEKGL